MANPVFVTCAKNAWTKVSTNVKTGQIWKISNKPNSYLQTYRNTGDPTPVNKSDGVLAFSKNNFELISSTDSIDVYIYAFGDAGQVRSDL